MVDDGIARGASIFVAIQWIKEQNPKFLILAVPVAPRDAIQKLENEVGVDQVVVLETPERFGAVGAFYEDFSRVMTKY